MQNAQNLHQGGPVLSAGVPLIEAKNAMIMIHGRGASADDILGLATYLQGHQFAFFAPQAANSQWYPQRFIRPLEENEPWLSSALQVISDLIAQINQSGVATDQIMLLGFSQGACLSLEYAARHPQQYAGVVALSGALIGPPDMPRHDSGSLAGTPIFLGCSDVDMHIPKERVDFSQEVLSRMDAQVTKRIYPGMGHTVNDDEIDFVRAMMADAAQSGHLTLSS